MSGAVFAGLPAAGADDPELRASIRRLRAADGLLLGVLDDDPTGAQAVHDVDVVTVLTENVYQAALARPAATCFVLTNSRSLAEPGAAEVTARAARGLMAAASRRGGRIQLISRSDSTLRGHLMAEVTALHAVRREVFGCGFDAVLLIPAFIEAGRLTVGDIHWARTAAGLVPVGETEFARDPAVGYRASDLKDFVAEKSRGALGRDDVVSISLSDIRSGGPGRVRELLGGLRDGTFVIVNASEYSDLETVACGVLLAERSGQRFLFRTGPSFVRALAGIEPAAPLRGGQLWPAGRPAGRHGLVVVGSHVGQTSRQLAMLRAGADVTGIELSVPDILSGTPDLVASAAGHVSDALGRSDVVLYTSRGVAGGQSPEHSLRIARTVSAAVARTVRQALAARPAWILAKGGITAHDVALHGLGIRRANVAGQLFPGLISVLRPVDAAPEALGMPYVVFAGNVGDDSTLAQVVAILNERDVLADK
jgi:uncharacterized protein YgbK (DUF1537 family)